MKLKELREKRGLYQSQIAEAVGVSIAAVCKWETGAAEPRSDKLPVLADLIGCTIDELYGRPGPPGTQAG